MQKLREAIDELFRAIIEYRDSVLRDLVANVILFSGDNLGRISKSIEQGSKKQWKKSALSIGTSSKISIVLKEGEEGVKQKFIKDDKEKKLIAANIQV